MNRDEIAHETPPPPLELRRFYDNLVEIARILFSSEWSFAIKFVSMFHHPQTSIIDTPKLTVGFEYSNRWELGNTYKRVFDSKISFKKHSLLYNWKMWDLCTVECNEYDHSLVSVSGGKISIVE